MGMTDEEKYKLTLFTLIKNQLMAEMYKVDTPEMRIAMSDEYLTNYLALEIMKKCMEKINYELAQKDYELAQKAYE